MPRTYDDEVTPKSRIKSQLRLIWLRSRERNSALRRDKYSCVKCGVKQSKAKGKEQKVEVHHKNLEINWDELIDIIRNKLLCDIEDLETLCPDCHDEITYN